MSLVDQKVYPRIQFAKHDLQPMVCIFNYKISDGCLPNDKIGHYYVTLGFISLNDGTPIFTNAIGKNIYLNPSHFSNKDDVLQSLFGFSCELSQKFTHYLKNIDMLLFVDHRGIPQSENFPPDLSSILGHDIQYKIKFMYERELNKYSKARQDYYYGKRSGVRNKDMKYYAIPVSWKDYKKINNEILSIKKQKKHSLRPSVFENNTWAYDISEIRGVNGEKIIQLRQNYFKTKLNWGVQQLLKADQTYKEAKLVFTDSFGQPHIVSNATFNIAGKIDSSARLIDSSNHESRLPEEVFAHNLVKNPEVNNIFNNRDNQTKEYVEISISRNSMQLMSHLNINLKKKNSAFHLLDILTTRKDLQGDFPARNIFQFLEINFGLLSRLDSTQLQTIRGTVKYDDDIAYLCQLIEKTCEPLFNLLKNSLLDLKSQSNKTLHLYIDAILNLLEELNCELHSDDKTASKMAQICGTLHSKLIILYRLHKTSPELVSYQPLTNSMRIPVSHNLEGATEFFSYVKKQHCMHWAVDFLSDTAKVPGFDRHFFELGLLEFHRQLPYSFTHEKGIVDGFFKLMPLVLDEDYVSTHQNQYHLSAYRLLYKFLQPRCRVNIYTTWYAAHLKLTMNLLKNHPLRNRPQTTTLLEAKKLAKLEDLLNLKALNRDQLDAENQVIYDALWKMVEKEKPLHENYRVYLKNRDELLKNMSKSHGLVRESMKEILSNAQALLNEEPEQLPVINISLVQLNLLLENPYNQMPTAIINTELKNAKFKTSKGSLFRSTVYCTVGTILTAAACALFVVSPPVFVAACVVIVSSIVAMQTLAQCGLANQSFWSRSPTSGDFFKDSVKKALLLPSSDLDCSCVNSV